jgi:hypothetical protein
MTTLGGLLGAMVAVSVATPASYARPPRLACPPQAPAAWNLPKPAPLDAVGVLSQPIGQPIDETTPPSLLPDRGFARGNVWHNIWLMGDEPGWSHFIDCRYRGSARVLRLKADGLKRCEQTARPYAPNTGVAKGAAQTLMCD